MLFTGDIGEEVEGKLYNLKADILKVGHHGSKHSTSDLFLKKVSHAARKRFHILSE